MLLVTKAVGDFLGTNGIADEAIRFNGYPFLDKDDHAYNVPGASCFALTRAAAEITEMVFSIKGDEGRVACVDCNWLDCSSNRYVSLSWWVEIVY